MSEHTTLSVSTDRPTKKNNDPIEHTCEICSATFMRRPSQNGRYCSRTCAGKGYSIKYRGDLSAPRPSEKLPCVDCGGETRKINSKRCRKCANSQNMRKYNELKALERATEKAPASTTWDVRNNRIEGFRKERKLIKLCESNDKTLTINSIVSCFYSRTHKKNILAWTVRDAKVWARKNGMDNSEVVSSRCRISEVDINITGCDLPRRDV